MSLKNNSYNELKIGLSSQSATDKQKYRHKYRLKYMIAWISPALFLLAILFDLSGSTLGILITASSVGMLYSASFVYSYRSYREYLRKRENYMLKLKRAIDNSEKYSVFLDMYSKKFNIS